MQSDDFLTTGIFTRIRRTLFAGLNNKTKNVIANINVDIIYDTYSILTDLQLRQPSGVFRAKLRI